MQSPDDAYQTPMTGVPRKSARNQSVRPILQDHCPRGASSYVSGAELSNGRSTESPSGAFSAGIDGEEANGAVAENTQTGAVPGLTNNTTSAVLDSDSTAVEFLDAIQDGAPADGADVLTVASTLSSSSKEGTEAVSLVPSSGEAAVPDLNSAGDLVDEE